MEAMVTHRGGCHCGAVRFEVDAPADLEVLECNCSRCSQLGFLHLIVPRSNPDGYSVNARCLDEGSVRHLRVTPHDGRHWEQAPDLSDLSRE